MHEKEVDRPVELEEEHDSFFTDVYPLIEKLAPNSTLLLDWDDVVLIRNHVRTKKVVRPCIPDFINAIKSNRPDINICVLTSSTKTNSHATEEIGESLGIDGEYIYHGRYNCFTL